MQNALTKIKAKVSIRKNRTTGIDIRAISKLPSCAVVSVIEKVA